MFDVIASQKFVAYSCCISTGTVHACADRGIVSRAASDTSVNYSIYRTYVRTPN